MKLPDDHLSRKGSVFSLITYFTELDHAQKITFDMTAGNQPYEISIGKPAVNKQVIKADALLDDVPDYFNGLVHLLHRVMALFHDLIL